MGLSRYVKKVKRIALNSNPLVKALTGGVSNSKPSDAGARGEAAKRLKLKTEQAGSGQIKYMTEDDGTQPVATAAATTAPASATKPTGGLASIVAAKQAEEAKRRAQSLDTR